MLRSLTAAAVLCIAVALTERASAGIAYSTPGSTYSENFNGLPADIPGNDANIQANANYADGWQDDVVFTTSPEKDISVPGWHVWHPLAPTTGTPPENGFNDHQRLRNGPGANTGAFWLFGNAANNTEKALGSIGSTTVAGNNTSMLIGLQLVNNTGQTLDSFTLTYAGEEWRDGQATTPETLIFEYSLNSTDATWNTTGTYTGVAALNFTSPVAGGTGTSGTAVDGNVAGRVPNITATVTGLNWAAGSELWLRWSDPQVPSLADDGLAIDDVVFSATAAAVPEAGSFLFAGLVAGVFGMGRLARKLYA